MIRDEGRNASLIGALLLVLGAIQGSIALVVIGVPWALAGVATLTITRMGTVWTGLEAKERAAAWPGRIIGGWILLACVLAVIVLLALIGYLI
ncbi:hypothetical protein ACH40F_04395 [Streptomyces sp. NPDC020794]|uniref:hypothetical protein n=1 Tax=unclassified Streptomyces TaxID=2593676 RepID=UPI0036E9C32F